MSAPDTFTAYKPPPFPSEAMSKKAEFPSGEVYVRLWFLPGPREWKLCWTSEEVGMIEGMADAGSVEFDGVTVRTECGPPDGPDVRGAARGRMLAHGRLKREGDKVVVSG